MIGDILIGLATGLASGVIVYVLTKRRERKYQTYYFWHTFLLDTLKHCEIYIPDEILRHMAEIGNRDSEWQKAIYSILDNTRPFSLEDRELTEKENRVCKSVMIALKELYAWAGKNHLK